MATIKSYSDLQQSKKLAEILPLESADMYYIAKPDSTNSNMIPSDICIPRKTYLDGQAYGDFCAWSLAALLCVLPKIDNYRLEIRCIDKSYCCCCTEEHNGGDLYWYYADNPVDACYEMILKLNELNLL